jgi:hypothetical protein
VTRTLGASTVQLALAVCLGCVSLTDGVSSSQTASDVQLVEQAEYDEMRASGRYVFSEPMGEVAVTEPCASGTVDEECANAARQRLRNQAAERGANLVLLHPAATLQSYPPRYALRGVLYQVRANR